MSNRKFIRHSPESRAAAALTEPRAGTQRFAVLQFIVAQKYHGATDEEIQMGLGLNPSTQRPRRVELYEGRYIVKTRATRRTRSGRKAVVWLAGVHADGVDRNSYCIYPEQ